MDIFCAFANSSDTPAHVELEKIAGLAAQGVTEIVYQPVGSGIERELEAFASAAGLTG